MFLYSSKFIYENSYPELKLLFFFWRGFAEWIFIIGVYGVFREVFTKSYSWLPFLNELAMPFYLTHQQVLLPIAAGASWMNLGYIGNKILQWHEHIKIVSFRFIFICLDSINYWYLAYIMDYNKIRQDLSKQELLCSKKRRMLTF